MQDEHLEHIKDLQRIRDFRLLDDDFMNKAFEGQDKCVELVAGIILNDPDLLVEEHFSQTQYLIKNLQGKDIWMDIHAVDDRGREYNLEIQRADKGAGARRARRNSGLMDANCKDSGQYGEKLPETYVIFITENDVWGQGLPIYYIERYINGKQLFNDGAHIIYVNASYEDNTTELGRLLHDFRCNKAEDMYHEVLAERVRYFKETTEGVTAMCKAMEDMRNEAEARGLARGIENMVVALLKNKVDMEIIAKSAGVTLAKVMEIGRKAAVL